MSGVITHAYTPWLNVDVSEMTEVTVPTEELSHG